MVLHKRSEYGFHGYEIPTMPRGCRSARKKRSIRYHVVNPTELCAIDLLATVAGKLLLEKDKSTTPRPRAPVVKAEDVAAIVPLWTDDKPAVKVEPCDQGSCDEGALVIRSQKLSHKHAFKETTSQASTAPSAAFLESVTGRVDVVKPKTAVPGPVFPTPANARQSSPVMGASVSHKRDKEFAAAPATPIRDNAHCKNSNGTDVLLTDQRNKAKEAASSVKDPMDVDSNKPKPSPPSPALASSDSSVEVPVSDNSSPRRVMPCSSSIPRFSMDHDGNRDSDDDGEGSSSACTHPSTASPREADPTALRPQRIGDRRIRKLLSSRFWKVGSSSLKEGEFYDRDMLRSKKLCYTRQKSHRSCFKRKKLLERSSVSSSSAGVAVEEAISKLSPDCNKKSAKGEQGHHGTSSSITSHRTPLKSEDHKVKLKIKSFKVPEVFIEMPETATVGSLKRAVLETVTAMLGNGLKVGVAYQGRKVRDDSRTLLQAGISGGDNLDSLNFSLEPNASSPAPHQPIPHGSSSCRAEPLPPFEQCRSPRLLATRLPAVSEIRADIGKSPCDRPDGRELQQLRYQPEPKIVVGLASPIGSDNNSSSQTIVGTASPKRSCHAEAEASGVLVPSSTSPSLSKALVLVDPCIQSSSDLALAVVPASSNKMTRRPENGQRRIRRPFSVAEVEALVQAVEKLGTGRWRDVKLQAFENAKHRTYVDLKDKWKTLVHTARISPQQRRGEPVPQELLDRVLVAHAHWSQHQPRLQSSKHAANTSGGSGAAAPSPSCVAAGLLLPPPPTQAEQQPQPLALLPPPPQAATV